jgi:hypothetical protein
MPVTLVAVSIGIQWGVKGVALGYMLASLILTYPALKLVVQASPLALRDLWRPLVIPSWATIVSVVGCLAFKTLVSVADDFYPVVLLAIHACIFGFLYLSCWLAFAPCRSEIFDVIKTIQFLKDSVSRKSAMSMQKTFKEPVHEKSLVSRTKTR